jgi:hypothetical protein
MGSTVAMRRNCSTTGGTVAHDVMVVAARAAAKRGAANPRVSAAKKSGSDYHVSGEGLSRNWMDVLSHGGYNI